MYNYLINKSTLEFDKIYYVDSEIGNDTNGNGEELTPYKTIEKAYSLIANESCAIVLKGTFVDPVLTVNKNIFFIGYCEDTVIQISTIANFLTVSSSNINVNFYRLIINLEGVSSRIFLTMKTSNIFINFYNCVLQGNGGATSTVAGWLYDYNSSNVIITLFNCYIDTYGNCLFRGYNQPKCVNCVVVSVSQSTLSFGNAPITETCIFDKKKDIYIDYTIKSNLLNMGNGKNPDGTIANIGVYGEQYAWGDWKIHLYLIKQDDQYYSITSEYYKNGQYIPLSLSGGEQPNEDDYNNYGFDDIGDLCKTYNNEDETFKPIDKLNDEFEIRMMASKR